uniref:FHA domain-containing protein n=1 Tax=Cucumis sativus TaxID=3659 RepID=A0A0A0K684_CUCSA
MPGREEETPDRNELKVPVFTVLKNGATLKNIFIVNNVADREKEEVITLGRHPDCNIMLTHPSISRFHLQIHSNPSSQKIFVVDLSSVHGTWVSGKRIETGDEVEMKEGDTLRVGGSSRVYRLHWVPLSCAYDFEGPKEMKEHEVAIVEEKDVKDCEKEISLLDENKERAVDSVFDSIEPLYPDENWNTEMMKEVPLAPPLSEVKEMAVPLVNRVESVSDLRIECEQVETSLLSKPFGNELKGLEMSLQPPSLPLSAENLSFNVENIIMSSFFGNDNKISSSSMFEWNDTSGIWNIPMENISSNSLYGRQLCHSKTESPQQPSLHLSAENLSFNVENIIMSSFFDGESKSSSCNMPALENKSNILSVVDDTEATPDYATFNILCQQVTESFLDCLLEPKNDSPVKSTSEVTSNSPMTHNVECCVEETYNGRLEMLEPSKSSIPGEDNEHREELSESSFISCALEYVYSSLPDEEVPPEIAVEKECQTPHENLDLTLPIRSESASAMGGNISLRKGKPTSFPQIETGVSQTNRAGTLLTDEFNHEIVGEKSGTNTLAHLDDEEEEIFTPDKENFTPNTLLMKSLKKKASIEDSGNCFRSSKSQTSIFKSRHKIKLEEELSEESDKENRTPRVLQEQKLSKQFCQRRLEQENTMTKKGGGGRAPFQSLQSNVAGKKRLEAALVKKSARKSNTSVCTGAVKNKFTVEEKKCWTMVVDTDSLLSKESMKSLQLLQGLQGTQLIVPRIVIRELDSLRRHGSLFRKRTEAASILQWIEDCMVQTRWWIHVQSSEEGVAPVTPPATPQSPYTEGRSQSLFWRTSSIQSIKQRSFMEALSPTPEDHILDCALYFRRGVKHGQELVLISDDVTLKIKSMAEGLICETAKEFRESLVNPFSERFLWAESSPRGLTWSCPDDIVLRERYDRCWSRSSKGAEGAKGLKLILLHNSHYGMFR